MTDTSKNLGTSQGVSNRDIVNAAQTATGKAVGIHVVNQHAWKWYNQ
jgi:UDP-glucose 4-epimerase